MKPIIRVFVLGLCAVGASAAIASSHATRDLQTMNISHQAGNAAMPIPGCSPNHCGNTGGGN